IYRDDVYGYSITLDKLGNIYTTGSFEGEADFDPGPKTLLLRPIGDDDIFILKLDTLGNLVWAKNMGGIYDSGYGLSMALDSSNDIYTTGFFDGQMDFDPGGGKFNLHGYYYNIF